MTRWQRYAPVVGLGLTQIVGFGTLTYAYAVLLPRMAEDLGLSLSQAFGILSVALFIGGLVAPVAGRAIDLYGGRPVLTVGSLGAALTLLCMSQVSGQWGLFAAVLVMEFTAMFVLYDAAFASIAQIRPGAEARRAISQVTLLGGFASTVFWPLTLVLADWSDWRTTWMIFAGLHLVLCLPIHWFCLSDPAIDGEKAKAQPSPYPELTGRDRVRGMIWMVISFSFSGYIFGGIMALWVTNFTALGLTAAAATAAGALIGPAKVAGRLAEMAFGDRWHPLTTGYASMGAILFAFAFLFLAGATPVTVAIFAVIFGMGDGLRAIIRGTLPLALFGSKNYGARLGWVSFIRMGVNASAPFAFAALIEGYGPWVSFAVMAGCVGTGLAALAMIPRPIPTPSAP